jgi:hypothetical protein
MYSHLLEAWLEDREFPSKHSIEYLLEELEGHWFKLKYLCLFNIFMDY